MTWILTIGKALCYCALTFHFFLYDFIKCHNMETKENIVSSAQSYYSKGGVLNGRNGSIGADRNNDHNDTANNDFNNNDTSTGDNNNGFANTSDSKFEW